MRWRSFSHNRTGRGAHNIHPGATSWHNNGDPATVQNGGACGSTAGHGTSAASPCSRLSSPVNSAGRRSRRVDSTCPSLTKVTPPSSMASRSDRASRARPSGVASSDRRPPRAYGSSPRRHRWGSRLHPADGLKRAGHPPPPGGVAVEVPFELAGVNGPLSTLYSMVCPFTRIELAGPASSESHRPGVRAGCRSGHAAEMITSCAGTATGSFS